MSENINENESSKGVSRRGFLAAMGIGAGVGVLAGGGGAVALSQVTEQDSSEFTIAFRGANQAGITTAQQNHLHIVALDVLTEDANELKNMLTTWSKMAERMTQGLPAAEEGAENEYSVPVDSGEAHDLGAQNLTVTIGYGPTLFDARFGLEGKKPVHLNPLPTFPGDQLREELCDGDIVIQACADDPQVAVHAVRNLVRAGSGVVEVSWSQLGYGRASSTGSEQSTPRNLFGFKDGTRNIRSDETKDLQEFVWADEADWMNGGSYLCARRIRMLLELWDRQNLGEQQATFARFRSSGAPLGTSDDPEQEFAAVPFNLIYGREPAVPVDSHVFLSHPENNGGVRILRRAYNFVEGSDTFGHLSAGLFFIAFSANPDETFIPIQMRLARNDRMNEYVRYESKAIFACPRGLKDGEDWGSQLFNS